MTFTEFLKFATNPSGIGAISSFLVYAIIKYYPKAFEWFKGFMVRLGFAKMKDKQMKRILAGVLAFTIPIPFAFLKIPFGLAEMPTSPQMWVNVIIWPVIWASFVAFSGSTLIHTKDLE